MMKLETLNRIAERIYNKAYFDILPEYSYPEVIRGEERFVNIDGIEYVWSGNIFAHYDGSDGQFDCMMVQIDYIYYEDEDGNDCYLTLDDCRRVTEAASDSWMLNNMYMVY